MKAIVFYIRDDVVVQRTIEGRQITAKILVDGRGYVTADNRTHLFRRVETIDLDREDA